MYAGNLVFAGVMAFAPGKMFGRLAEALGGVTNARAFRYPDQFPSMAFEQLTYRERLHDTGAFNDRGKVRNGNRSKSCHVATPP